MTGVIGSVSLDAFDRRSGNSSSVAPSDLRNPSYSPSCSSPQVQLHSGRCQINKQALSTSAAVEAWAPVDANGMVFLLSSFS